VGSRPYSLGSLGANSGWSVVGTGDFNGDGTTDVLLSDAPTGTVVEWLMHNGQQQPMTIGSLGTGDLSPNFHPAIGRVVVSFALRPNFGFSGSGWQVNQV
jgi:hypothetical protein